MSSQYNIYPALTPVRVASSGNVSGTYFNGNSNNGVGATLTIAASSLTIDSVVCVVNDRVLLYAQSSANQNGIYIVLSIGSTVVLQRSADMQSIEQYKEGQYVFAAAGSILAGDSFTLIEPLPAALGISNMSWASGAAAGYVQFSGPASVANALAVFSDTAGDIKAQSTASTLGFGLTISTGNFAVSAGNIAAGSSGHAGTITSFPGTAANGSLIIAAVNNSNNFASTLSNSAVGQASVYTLPDPAAATANIAVAPAALVNGNLIAASGTAGLIIDSGAPAPKFAQVSMTAAQFNGMYAAPFLLVAAPGANSMIIVDSIALVMTFVSADYAAGGVVAAQYDSTAHGAGVIASSTEAAADFFAAASTVFKLNSGAVLSPFSSCANKGLYLSNLTQAFTTGDSTWIIKVYYHVVSTNS